MWVREGVTCRGASVGAPHAPIPFDRWWLWLAKKPAPSAGAPKRATRRRVDNFAQQTLLDQFPWLDAGDFGPEVVKGCHHKRATPGGCPKGRAVGEPRPRKRENDPDDLEGASPGPATALEQPPEQAIDVSTALDELADLRGVHEWDEHDPTFFYSRLLGGRSTKAATGEAADGARGVARAGAPTECCSEYAWPKTRSFMFGRYGREGASTVAREWARSADYFFRLYLESGELPFRYTQEHVDGCPESSDLLDWLCSLDTDSPAFAVGVELRKLAPRLR